MKNRKILDICNKKSKKYLSSKNQLKQIIASTARIIKITELRNYGACNYIVAKHLLEH